MIDVKERLLPHENVQFQYGYPLWMKILVGAALVVVGWMLYDDIRAARYFFVVIEAGLTFYVLKWLVEMLRDSSQYVVTDRRVMRLYSEPSTDLLIPHQEISEVRVLRDKFSGSGFVVVKAADGREIRIPMPSMSRGSGEKLSEIINRQRPNEGGAQAE